MKKLISVLLCFALLFSFSVFSKAQEVPNLTLNAYSAFTNHTSSVNGYVCFDFFIENCASFESFDVLITFNPQVLAYSPVYPFAQTEIEKNATVCTVLSPGKVQINGSPASHCVCRDFDPFCFKVIGEGPTDIQVMIVSWKDADGEIENGNFETNILNFNAVSYETIKPLLSNPSAVQEEIMFRSWKISEKMTVEQFMATSPTDMFKIYNTNGEELTADDIIGTGCTYKLNVYDQYFKTKSLIVANDITGDGLVSSYDARLALRFAVGLDTPTAEQCLAAGVGSASGFHSSVARDILRAAVGLPT